MWGPLHMYALVHQKVMMILFINPILGHSLKKYKFFAIDFLKYLAYVHVFLSLEIKSALEK